MNKKNNPWFWVPSLYFAEGFPYIMVMTVSVIMYKKMGISNAQIAFWTSLLNLPWVIKPIWGPIVELFSNKKRWVLVCEIAGSIVFLLIALALNLSSFFFITVAFFLVMAFISATQDIAVDGIYISSLSSKDQAFFVGFRSTFYRVAILTGQGLMVIIAGMIETHTGLGTVEVHLNMDRDVRRTEHFFDKTDKGHELHLITPREIVYASSKRVIKIPVRLSSKPKESKKVLLTKHKMDINVDIISGGPFVFDSSNWNKDRYFEIKILKEQSESDELVFLVTSGNIRFSWIVTLLISSVLFFLLACYHFKALPEDKKRKLKPRKMIHSFIEVFSSFFNKKNIGTTLLFLFTYRFSEAQILKLASPFLIDSNSVGGLGLSTKDVGMIYGTFGSISLTLGGLIGGFIISKYSLKKVLWFMVIAINLPNGLYLLLSLFQPYDLFIVGLSVALEQFGYGFGFTAYMLYLIHYCKGKYETAHFAIATGIMAFGMMIPGMVSGYIQKLLGYNGFFLWTILASLPAFLSVMLIIKKIDFSSLES